jgi:uncharacterized membrane protein YfcA
MLTTLGYDELAWIFVALAFGGFTKGLTGLGLPLITVPVLAGVFGVERAVLIMVIPSSLLNFYPAWTHRDQSSELPEIWHILLGAIPGVAIGATVLRLASDRFLATSLALWIIAYLLLRLFHPEFSISAAARRRWSPVVGMSAGALQAATGISAPIIAPYMDALGLKPRAYVFAVCACFGVFATVHLGLVVLSGAYTASLIGQSMLAILPALAFIQVGFWARKFVSQRWFDWIIRLTLVVMTIRILYGAWFTQTAA